MNPERRTSGLLLHPTSFPGGPIGTLGKEAFRWLDWLQEAGQGIWQVLPLVAVDEGGSPYNGLSAMAGNTMLLDAEYLAREGWVDDEPTRTSGSPRADFVTAAAAADDLVRRAHARLDRRPGERERFEAFVASEASWLADYSLFRVLRDVHGDAGWLGWPAALRDRQPEALARARTTHALATERVALGQYLFQLQWEAVRTAAAARGIRILGDIPIFVAHDSADVWANPHLFHLDAERRSTVVSGVPPDYFSATGQLWGNPLYDWDAMARDGYRWWTARFRRTLSMVDIARIDHFRGFESYWEVPAGAPDAIRGSWRAGPGQALFRAVEAELGPLPLVAEDLGIITPEVDRLRQALGMPGMRVLQFAFGDDEANPHLPGNHPPDSVAYTGTHDNDTARGWWQGGASEADRAGVRRLISAHDDDIHWGMIEAVFRSPAQTAVVPLQDVLGLGSEARMNVPGVAGGNWGWRYQAHQLTTAAAGRLREITAASGRSAWTTDRG